MQLYFLALIVLSVAAVMEARCSTPALRPSAYFASRAFAILGRSAFIMWVVMVGWGIWSLPWWQPVAGIMGSLAANALVVGTGGHPLWPGISMGLSLLGLFLAAFAVK